MKRKIISLVMVLIAICTFVIAVKMNIQEEMKIEIKKDGGNYSGIYNFKKQEIESITVNYAGYIGTYNYKTKDFSGIITNVSSDNLSKNTINETFSSFPNEIKSKAVNIKSIQVAVSVSIGAFMLIAGIIIFLKKTHDLTPEEEIPAGNKSRTIALVLASIPHTAFLGIDRFYLGLIWTGILKFLTCGGCLVWYIIDIVRIANGTARDKWGKPLRRGKLITIVEKPVSSADELLKYAELLEKGFLTKEEFDKKKADILNIGQ